jgi:hypothetical protein
MRARKRWGESDAKSNFFIVSTQKSTHSEWNKSACKDKYNIK